MGKRAHPRVHVRSTGGARHRRRGDAHQSAFDHQRTARVAGADAASDAGQRADLDAHDRRNGGLLQAVTVRQGGRRDGLQDVRIAGHVELKVQWEKMMKIAEKL